jgi:hypothetical protein
MTRRLVRRYLGTLLCMPTTDGCRIHLRWVDIKKTRCRSRYAMDSIKAKLDQAAGRDPEEARKMDEEVRANKRSVVARRMIADLQVARARGMSTKAILDDVHLARWKAEFPRLFEMVLDPKCSPAMLNAMLRQLEAVEAGSRSTHEASVAVGTLLVNQYVRPTLGMESVPLPGSEKQSPRR